MKRKCISAIILLAAIFTIFAFNVKDVILGSAEAIPEQGIKKAVAGAFDRMGDLSAIKYPCVNINGAWQRLTGHRYVYDANRNRDQAMVKGNYLITAKPKPYERSDLEASLNALEEVRDYLKKEEKDLLYVQGAGKGSCDTGVDLVNDAYLGQQDDIDFFIKGLKDRGIDHLDSRDVLGPELSDYYRADHHWTTEAALELSESIREKLNDKGLDISDLEFNSEYFDIDVKKGVFLGAEGRRVGRYYVGLDDLAVIRPSFRTSFSVTLKDKHKTVRRDGPFDESIMTPGMDLDHYSFTEYAYYMYFGKDHSIVRIKNKERKEGKKALLIKDSYGIPVSAFLSTAFKETVMADLRYCKKGSLIGMIEKYDPDVVIYIYGPGYLNRRRYFTLGEQR